MSVTLEPIGFVRSSRTGMHDDDWGGTLAVIELTSAYGAEALQGLDAFSHVEVIYHFHLVETAKVVSGARHPRNNSEWPRVGIFAQRGKNRPNRLGSTICRIASVFGTQLTVAELDAVDGTPVLDLKPVMREFLPRDTLRQPDWSHAVMERYWHKGEPDRSGSAP